MHKITFFILAFIVFLSTIFSSCDDDPVADLTTRNDSIAGIFGYVALYDEYGQEKVDFSGITVVAKWIDSSTVADTTDFGNEIYLSGTKTTTTNADGGYKFENTESGSYTLMFSAEGYGKNYVYAYAFDSTQVDTLELIKLAKTPPGTIELIKVYPDQSKKIYNIKRILNFTGSPDIEYGLVSRYFFSTAPDVDSARFVFTTIIGASMHYGGETDILTVKVSANSLLNAGIKEHDTVYVIAYLDNFHYTSYRTTDSTFVFPNLSSPSNMLHFSLDSIPESE